MSLFTFDGFETYAVPPLAIERTTPGGAGVNEVQTLTYTGAVDGAANGVFQLAYQGCFPASLTAAYDSTAAVIQAMLEDIARIGSGNVAVSGDAGGPWVVTFKVPCNTKHSRS